MRRLYTIVLISLTLLATCYLPLSVRADCSGLLVNPGFEGAAYKTEALGTSLSSNLGEGWTPWSILGDATFNREVEYKPLDAATLPDRYRIHSGNRSQKLFTTWGTHTAGFYQRVKVVPGSKVTFSIWVQIYTGERELSSGGRFISDLESPTEEDKARGPGGYKVFVGIDPYGDTPPAFGAPPSSNTVWSNPVIDYETRRVDSSGVQIDDWVQLSVSTIAQREYITVYTKGQPEFPVKHNDSFWDDACLIVQLPPTATPKPTATPTATPSPTETLSPTVTPQPTATALPPTATPDPTATTQPTSTTLPSRTPQPTRTAVPSTVTRELPSPTPTQAAAPTTPAPTMTMQFRKAAQNPSSGSAGLFLIYGVALLVIVVILWLRLGPRS